MHCRNQLIAASFIGADPTFRFFILPTPWAFHSMPAVFSSFGYDANTTTTSSRDIAHLIYHGLVRVVTEPSPVSPLKARLTVMLVILVVSMIAVSFPAVSDSGVVRVPTPLFFIGKHFGTGVILATAFIHLLPDSFHALLSESVSEMYGDVGRWVGLIMCVSSTLIRRSP